VQKLLLLFWLQHVTNVVHMILAWYVIYCCCFSSEARLWACNFNLQLAKALTTENDHVGAVRALDTGLRLAASIHQPPLQMVFSTARVHVQLMQWEEPTVIEQGLSQCDTFFDAIPQHLRRLYLGLHIYKELLHTFYLLRACEYKEAQAHVAALDAALSAEEEVPQEEPLNTSQQPDPAAQIQELQHQLEWLRNELQIPGVPQQRASDLHYHYGIVQQKLVHLQQSR
jgi:MAternally-affected-uncoordination protein